MSSPQSQNAQTKPEKNTTGRPIFDNKPAYPKAMSNHSRIVLSYLFDLNRFFQPNTKINPILHNIDTFTASPVISYFRAMGG